MSFRLLLTLPALIAGSLSAAPLHEPLLYSGYSSHCSGGRRYELNYSVTHILGENFSNLINLETVPGLVSIDCGIDESALVLTFNSLFDAAKLWTKLKAFSYFLTTGSALTCNHMEGKQRQGVLIRRVIDAQTNYGYNISIRTAKATYTDFFEDADISSQSKPDHSCELLGGEASVCIGMNAKPDCSGFKNYLYLFNNSHISVDCDNCVAMIKAEIFFELKIRHWSLYSISSGFRQATLFSTVSLKSSTADKFIDDHNITVDWSAKHYNWSVAAPIDLHPWSEKGHKIFDFLVGPVPFNAYYNWYSALNLSTSILDKSAKGKLFVQYEHALGDCSTTWDKSGWTSTCGVPDEEVDSDCNGAFPCAPGLLHCLENNGCYKKGQKGCPGKMCPDPKSIPKPKPREQDSKWFAGGTGNSGFKTEHALLLHSLAEIDISNVVRMQLGMHTDFRATTHVTDKLLQAPRQLCMDANIGHRVFVASQFNLNLDFLDLMKIHHIRTWGPDDIFSTKKTLLNKCVDVDDPLGDNVTGARFV